MKCDLCSRIREHESPHPVLCVSCAELIARLGSIVKPVAMELPVGRAENQTVVPPTAASPNEMRAHHASLDTFVRDCGRMD